MMDQLEMPNTFSRACVELNQALGAVKTITFRRVKSTHDRFTVPFK